MNLLLYGLVIFLSGWEIIYMSKAPFYFQHHTNTEKSMYKNYKQQSSESSKSIEYIRIIESLEFSSQLMLQNLWVPYSVSDSVLRNRWWSIKTDTKHIPICTHLCMCTHMNMQICIYHKTKQQNNNNDDKHLETRVCNS